MMLMPADASGCQRMPEDGTRKPIATLSATMMTMLGRDDVRS
ncbi:MAG: hypothetical protein WBN88_06800 [Anderseniella sp.]